MESKRKKLQQSPGRSQRLEFLVEQTLTEVRRIAEGHGALQRQIEQLRQELTARMDDLENRMNLGFREVFQRLDRLEQRVGQLEQQVDQLRQELGQVKQAVLENSKRLEVHEQVHGR